MTESRNRQRTIQRFVRNHSKDPSPSMKSEPNRGHGSHVSGDEEEDRLNEVWTELDGLQDWAESELRALDRESISQARNGRNVWASGAVALAAGIALWVLVPFFVPAGSTFSTKEAEQRQLTLEDGSRIHLNTGSSVRVHFSKDARKIELERGEGVFDVEHDRRRPFVVSAGANRIQAIGTRFSVYLQDQELTVTVLEGKVAALPATPEPSRRKPLEDAATQDDRKVFIGPDSQAKLSASGTLQELRPVDAKRVTAWTDGRLIFEKTPLRKVVAEMSRYVPGEISVAPEVPDHPVTGIIQIRNPDNMIDLLTKVVPVTAVRNTPRSTVLYDAR